MCAANTNPTKVGSQHFSRAKLCRSMLPPRAAFHSFQHHDKAGWARSNLTDRGAGVRLVTAVIVMSTRNKYAFQVLSGLLAAVLGFLLVNEFFRRVWDPPYRSFLIGCIIAWLCLRLIRHNRIYFRRSRPRA